MTATARTVLMGFVGDLFCNRDEPEAALDSIAPALADVDLLFGNLESAYSDDPAPPPGAPSHLYAPSSNLSAFHRFDVLSLANNHSLDAGPATLVAMREALGRQGVACCGAGADLQQARSPALLEADGLRIAVIAASSVFPHGYEAGPDRPGLAPQRAHSHWRTAYPTLEEPGTRPIVTTSADAADLDALAETLQSARAQADLVIASFHWGDYSRRFHLTDYEREIAHHAIDQGADLVAGHHHHALRGIEWHAGKPIFYGLSHFLFDVNLDWQRDDYRAAVAATGADALAYFDQTSGPDDWPYPLSDESRMTMIAWARLGPGGAEQVGFLPCWLDKDRLVRPLAVSSERGEQVIDYVEEAIRSQGLNGVVERDCDVTLGGFATVSVGPAKCS